MCPAHNINIVLGDFNVKDPVCLCQVSPHIITTPYSMRLIDFAAAKNIVVCSIIQFGLIVVDGRHVSNVLNTFRKPNIDSTNSLIATQIRLRISSLRSVRPSILRKPDHQKTTNTIDS